jgi:hypothetical protein
MRTAARYDPIAAGTTAPRAGSIVEVDFKQERTIGVVQRPTDADGKTAKNGRSSFSVYFESDGSTWVIKPGNFFREILAPERPATTTASQSVFPIRQHFPPLAKQTRISAPTTGDS